MNMDTIIAISTPLGYGGIGIVRFSGPQALQIAKKIFKPKNAGENILEKRPVLGYLYDFLNKDLFDEAYLTFFPAPNTYTREEMVEISCHGSPIILEEVIRLGIKAGARHANPGEFTLRAYLQGRIDILQAEAVDDIIRASSLKQAKISFKQMGGSLSKKINVFRRQIIHLLSQVEAVIEFPDEGLKITPHQISITLDSVLLQVKELLESYDLAKALGEGLSLAIAGRTNVGKSTLFNALLESERAIVSTMPGTTRDYIREKVKIKDITFQVIDMAGMDRTVDPIEQEGIKRGKKVAAESEGILLLFDVSQEAKDEDLWLIKKFGADNAILLFNKIDLPRVMKTEKIEEIAKNLPSLEISALKGTNLKKLKETIYKQFSPNLKEDDELILHLRQKLLLEDIFSILKKGIDLLKSGYTEEIFVEEIRKTLPFLGQLTGEIHTDDVLNEIFNRFCVGK
jgi:tRNA modification GTPase